MYVPREKAVEQLKIFICGISFQCDKGCWNLLSGPLDELGDVGGINKQLFFIWDCNVNKDPCNDLGSNFTLSIRILRVVMVRCFSPLDKFLTVVEKGEGQ